MAKHSAFWVIVAGAVPTAFRARNADELLPTLKQLQRTQPNVTMKWFERGRFWQSPEAAEQAARERGRRDRERDAGWRPGGAHADPRARFKLSRDEKRARFKRRLTERPDGPTDVRRPPPTKERGPDGSRSATKRHAAAGP